jgi:hypothetical protein
MAQLVVQGPDNTGILNSAVNFLQTIPEITQALRGFLENRERGDSHVVGFVIQALDVDQKEPWPDGRHRQKDKTLPF